ncbi:UNVERIFIED_CONTAM: Chromodomain-helicase-DNA-binding protein 1-like [Siphonaria sp. JEL0065]|nr:Chromodomain-helicase-DNA-binding protein 1-like [Siphonaria sp. JEL0065]
MSESDSEHSKRSESESEKEFSGDSTSESENEDADVDARDAQPELSRSSLKSKTTQINLTSSLAALPPGLLKHSITLRDYQLAGVAWMAALFDAQLGGGILADEMGLGKTLQTISFLLYLKQCRNVSGPFLIVTPLSVLENWKVEFTKFASSPNICRVIKYTGSKDERAELRERIGSKEIRFDVLLVTYENVCNDIEFIRDFNWKVVVIDEAHRLKNPFSLLHTALLTLSPSPFKILLTGTPVQNNLNELESLLSFSCPSVFGASPPDGSLLRLYGSGSTEKENNELLKELNELIKPFMLRREKETVLTLPPMKETILYAPMTDIQKKLYKSILTKDMTAFDSGKKTGLMNILMQLRKCCNHPYLFDGIEPEPFEAGDHLFHAAGKLEVLDRLLSHLYKNRHRVLIFSQMTHMLDILQDYLTYREYTSVRLDGSIRGQERYDAVSSFNEKDAGAFVFLLSTRAGGVGLNLTTADTVIFVDSDFNPMMDMQAAARAHRIGQTKPVSVIRLLTEGSVEEVIFRRARAKRSLSDKVISSGGSSSNSSSNDVSNDLKSPSELISILRFGVSNLVVNGGDGGVEDRAKLLVDQYIQDSIDFTGGGGGSSMDLDVEAVGENATIYLYDGTDYKKDEDAFLQLKEEVAVVTKSHENEAAQKSAQEQAERAAALQAKREAKQREHWKKIGYTSHALASDIDDSVTEDGEENEDQSQQTDDTSKYFVLQNGSITEPFVGRNETGIIIHIVDDSGNWPARGVFAALSQMYSGIEIYYRSSWEAKNLPLGSAHVLPQQIPVKSGGSVQVCLLVAQKRGRDGSLGSIRFPDLEAGLFKVGKAAKLMGASVHLPRFGQATPGFDWYQTERIIRKCLPSQRVKTLLYYFRRNKHVPPPRLPSQGVTPTQQNSAYSTAASRQPASSHQSVGPSSSSIAMKRTSSKIKTIDSPASKKPKQTAANTSSPFTSAPNLPAAVAAASSPVSVRPPDISVKKVAFIYGIRDAEKRAKIKDIIGSVGGSVMDGWDPNQVNLVVVADENTKEDLSDGCKSGVVIMTVDDLPFQRHFRVPVLSQATFLACLLSIASLVLPLVWAYAGQSQPAVTYMRDSLIILDGVDAVTSVPYSYFFSTNPKLNQLFEANIKSVPNIKVSEVDETNDGIADYLSFTIRVPLQPTDSIQRVRVAMFLRYDLESVARMTMQSAILFDESTSVSASSFRINADLRIVQRELLFPPIDNYDYNTAIMNYTFLSTGKNTDSYLWSKIIERYEDRNIRTKLDVTSPPTWESPRAINQPFTIHGKIRYSKDMYSYRPSIMEVLKAAWIQYLAYFVLIYTACRIVFRWAIRSGVVGSHVIVDVMPKQDGFRGHVF